MNAPTQDARTRAVDILLESIYEGEDLELIQNAKDTPTVDGINARLEALEAARRGFLMEVASQKEALLAKGKLLSSFNKLPLELQTTILKDHLDLYPGMKRHKRKIDLFLVSTGWMETIRGTPALWTEVPLGRSALVAAALAHSGSLPLNAEYDGGFWDDPWDCSAPTTLSVSESADLLAETAAERLRSLKIETSDFEPFENLLSTHFSILKMLVLLDPREPDSEGWQYDDVTVQVGRSLEYLHTVIVQVNFDCPYFSGLKVLRSESLTVEVQDLYVVLQACPRLERLTWFGVLQKYPNPPSRPKARFTLPNLQSLVLEHVAGNIALQILSSIRADNLSHLYWMEIVHRDPLPFPHAIQHLNKSSLPRSVIANTSPKRVDMSYGASHFHLIVSDEQDKTNPIDMSTGLADGTGMLACTLDFFPFARITIPLKLHLATDKLAESVTVFTRDQIPGLVDLEIGGAVSSDEHSVHVVSIMDSLSESVGESRWLCPKLSKIRIKQLPEASSCAGKSFSELIRARGGAHDGNGSFERLRILDESGAEWRI